MKSYWFLLVLLCCVFAVFEKAEAVTYKYTDQNGLLCFADDLQSIPEQYRSHAVLVEGGQSEKPATGAGVAAGGAGEQAKAPVASASAAAMAVKPRTGGMPISIRLLITFCVLVCVIIMAGVVSRLPKFSEDTLARISLRSGTAILVLLYIIVAHGRDIVTVMRMAGNAVDSVQAKSAEKGKKAAEGIKRLDAMFEELQAAEEMLKKEQEQEQTAKSNP